jgi:branched-chain amino acid transport system substrate-binding protein
LLLASACSLGTFDRIECRPASDDCAAAGFVGSMCGPDGYCVAGTVVEDCTTSAECRAENGFGSVCEAGACRPFVPNPRCARSFPETLLTNPSAYSGALVVGSIVERGFGGDAVLENAAELAVFQANEGGGLEADRPIGIVFCDMSEDASLDLLTLDDAAVSTAEWLHAELGVAAIHGPTTSGSTELVFEAIRDTDTLLISPSATSPSLTLLDNPTPTDEQPGLLWRTVPPDSLQGSTIAEDMILRGITRVSVVAENGSYGLGLQNQFIDEFVDMGGTIVGTPQAFASSAERDAAIAGSATGSPEEILFISGEISDSVAFLNVAGRTPAFEGIGVFLTDTSKTDDIFTETAPAAASVFERLRLTAPAPGRGAVYDTFAAAYAARYPEDPRQFGFLPQAYDATWLLIYGTAWAVYQEGSVTGTHIGRGLRRVSSGTSSDITGAAWRAVRSAFRGGSPVNVNGASGALDYDPSTEETEAPIEVIVALIRCDDMSYTFVTVAPGEARPTDCLK